MSSLASAENDSTVKFVCPHCTFINRHYDKMCEMCYQNRPIDVKPESIKEAVTTQILSKSTVSPIPNNIPTSMQRIEDILKKIDVMVTANNELIQQINAQNESVNLITYVITRQADGKQVATEQTTANPAQTVIAQWRGSIELTPIDDIFNDKINFQCANFQDLVRLNKDMINVARRYKLFGDTQAAIQEINKFEKNYRLIQTALRQLLELINTGGRGHLADIEDQLESINSYIEELHKNYKNLRFA